MVDGGRLTFTGMERRWMDGWMDWKDAGNDEDKRRRSNVKMKTNAGIDRPLVGG